MSVIKLYNHNGIEIEKSSLCDATGVSIGNRKLFTDKGVEISTNIANSDADPLPSSITLTRLFGCLSKSSTIANQGMAVYGDNAFVGIGSNSIPSKISVFSISGTSLTLTESVSVTSELSSTWHHNTLIFGTKKSEGEQYPVLWSSEWDGYNRLAAIKVTKSEGSFSFEMLNTIELSCEGIGSGYRDFAIDDDNNRIISIAYLNDGDYINSETNKAVVSIFSMPTLTKDRSCITLTSSNLIDTFTIDDAIEYRQGVYYYKGHLYVSAGHYNVSEKKIGVVDISLSDKSVVTDLRGVGTSSVWYSTAGFNEIESVFVYDGNVCASGLGPYNTSLNVYKIS